MQLRLPRASCAVVVIFFLPAGSVLGAQRQATAHQRAPSPSNASSFFADAKTLFQQGKLEESKLRLRDEIPRQPGNPEGYTLLGLVNTAQQNYAEALTAFQQALQRSPKSAGIRKDMGDVYVLQGNLPQAEKEFREVLRLNPADADGNYNLGLVLLAKKLPADALLYFQRVAPATTASRFNLAKACLEAGRISEGLRAAKELSAQNKDNLQVHFTLGVMLASEKQLRAAQFELEQANALQPQNFEILHDLGGVYLRNGEFEQAEAELQRALSLKPDSPETIRLLGELYAQQSRPVDALDQLVRAHKIAPENVDIMYSLARVSMSQNYYEDAIPLLDSAVKLAPARADLHAALGESLFISGKVEKAVEQFQELITLNPAAGSYAFMGLCYRQLGRFDEARKYFQAGLKKDPHNAACLFNLGYIDEHQGNYVAAEQFFQETLRARPDHAEALFEVANLRIAEKQFAAAAEFLRKYIRLAPAPAQGYYKLALVERNLHQMDAAQRDLNVFQTLSKNAATGPYPFQHLFDYLDNRAVLTAPEKVRLDLTELAKQIEKNPDQPENLFLLAEGYLKLGNVDEARKAVAQIDQLSGGDYRTETGVGVLLAHYHLYDDAIQHFQSALQVSPESDDVKFDLANTYFRAGLYQQAFEIAQQVSVQGQQDDASLSLLGDIKVRLGQTAEAEQIFRNAIRRNPDNDQYYLSVALLQLRQNDLAGAEKILRQGLARIPSSGKMLWAQGVLAAMEGQTAQAAALLEQAVDLLPEWVGTYSTLGVFYYQTGQIDKAREVLNRFKGSSSSRLLDIDKIAEALEKAPPMPRVVNEPMPAASRQQLLRFALSMADRTL